MTKLDKKEEGKEGRGINVQQCLNDKLMKTLAYICLSLWGHTQAHS